MSEGTPVPAAPLPPSATPLPKSNRGLIIGALVGGVCLVGLLCCGGSAVVAIIGFGNRSKVTTGSTGGTSSASAASKGKGDGGVVKEPELAAEKIILGKWREDRDAMRKEQGLAPVTEDERTLQELKGLMLWEFREDGTATNTIKKKAYQVTWKNLSTNGDLLTIQINDSDGSQSKIQVTIINNNNIRIAEGGNYEYFKRAK